jgi:hypothetical protein
VVLETHKLNLLYKTKQQILSCIIECYNKKENFNCTLESKVEVNYDKENLF